MERIAERCEVRRWDHSQPIPHEELSRQLKDADGLLTYGGRVNDALLDQAPRLKVVSNISVGYNNFDLEAMKSRRVLGTHTPYVLDETVADLTFGLMLSAARRIPELDALVKQGRWAKGDDSGFFGVDVHHAILGIIGMGRIGEAVARRARLGFSMEVLYYNRRRKPEVEQRLGAVYAELDELLSRADYIVVLVPLTDETHHLIGEQQFALMKRSAVFINVSRGKTVDEQALIQALEEGRIRAAGLDVFAKEPVDADNPLLRMPQVVTLPHIGSATHSTRMKMAMLAADNVIAGVHGERPPHVVPELESLLEQE